MPMAKGKSKSTISSNIREFHTGKTYARTAAKFGKKTADRQAVAAAMSQARRSGGGRKRKHEDGHEPHSAITHQTGQQHPM
jgi:hypothetical protein